MNILIDVNRYKKVSMKKLTDVQGYHEDDNLKISGRPWIS